MSDLPEVETTKRDLERVIVGLKIKEVKLTGLKRMIGGGRSKKLALDKLLGRTVEGVHRAGTMIDIDIGEDDSLMVDLGYGAHFRRTRANHAELPNERFVITFAAKGQLRLVDADQTTVMRILPLSEVDTQYPELARPGIDPFDDTVPWNDFVLRLRDQDRDLYGLLRDPSFVVGLGAVYTDEVLHTAQLRHSRIASELNNQEARRLHRSIFEVVFNAVKQRGNSLHGRVDLEGRPGKFDQFLEVYGRAGERCKNGKGDVQTIEIDGQVHHFCEYQG